MYILLTLPITSFQTWFGI